MVVTNFKGPWFQNTVFFLSPSKVTGIKALGWEEKEKKPTNKQKTGTKQRQAWPN